MTELYFSVVLTQANIRKAISVLFLLSITDTTCGHSKYETTEVIQFPVDTSKKAEMEAECTTSTSRSNNNKKRIAP